MRRRLGALGALLATLTMIAGAAVAAAPVAGADAPVPTSRALLTGTFVLAGTVTVADNVLGEHPGQAVYRTWAFRPGCASGACHTVTLIRQRAQGSDRLNLTRRGPGYYVGYSSFYHGLRCGSRIYRRGERVPFRITVRITQALVSNDTIVASRIRASYRNQVRYNLTPCVAYLGHDAAGYHGHVVLPAT